MSLRKLWLALGACLFCASVIWADGPVGTTGTSEGIVDLKLDGIRWGNFADSHSQTLAASFGFVGQADVEYTVEMWAEADSYMWNPVKLKSLTFTMPEGGSLGGRYMECNTWGGDGCPPCDSYWTVYLVVKRGNLVIDQGYPYTVTPRRVPGG
jgi:hypothetical protein